MGEDVERLKRRTPLLEYLRQHNWTGRPVGRFEYVGLCPLHTESQPSFYVNAHKDVFYCHGCGRGGDLIRFVQLSRGLSFHQSLANLDPESAPKADSSAVIEEAATFYQQQLDRCPEALDYLHRRGVHDPALFHELGIVDADKEAEVAEAAFQVSAIGEQVLARGGDSRRGLVNPEAVAFAEDADEIGEREISVPGGEVEVDESFEDGI